MDRLCWNFASAGILFGTRERVPSLFPRIQRNRSLRAPITFRCIKNAPEPSETYCFLLAAIPRTLSNAQSSIFIEICPYDNILSYPSDKPHRLVGAEKRKQILHCLEANLFARDAAELGPQAPRMKPTDSSVGDSSTIMPNQEKVVEPEEIIKFI